MKLQFIIGLITLVLAFACDIKRENELPINKAEVNFCSLLDSPEQYKFKIIQTKAIVLGYHSLILYSGECLAENKIIALEVNYESFRKIGEAITANRKNYKTSFLNNNLYAEITILGELKVNDEEQEKQVFKPKYRFFVTETKSVNVLSEEIFPNEKFLGAKEVKK